ncbi:TraR/DksA family transcriptional regulator [Bordetella sp. FB-8]|uniref:TraR/DksA family transcriptional regulator n=1 Tax=Bordetella sp. FB-8 TaxID=1159870 RepID=UPI00035FCD1A|nr:TraR/DksA family transcriptional regulator [Bordetella sp. FB-8]
MNHLSASALELLKARLVALRENALHEAWAAQTRSLDTVNDEYPKVQDPTERAESRREQEIDGAQADIDHVMADAAQAALQRISDGSYGTCLECGLPIRQSRLLAIPIAIRCSDCQRIHERRQAAR